jgi:hypothetical protein
MHNGGLPAPQQGTEMPARGITPRPTSSAPCLRIWGAERRCTHSGMDRKRRANWGRRYREDGSGHTGGGAESTPPFVCGQTGPHGNAPPPSCPAPIACNGAAQNPRATCELGGAKGKQSPPPASHVSTAPRRPTYKTPARPTFRVPCARRPVCGMACARWHAKGGACRGLVRGMSVGLCSHPSPPSCNRFPTWSRTMGLQ